MDLTPKVLLDGLVFPESPRWHKGKFWCVDMFGHQVIRMTAEGKVEQRIKFKRRPSGIGFLPDGRPLVVSMGDRRLVTIESNGEIKTYAGLMGMIGAHPNDMVVDGQGRAYAVKVGADALGGGERKPGYIVLVTPDRQARLVADGLAHPNGICVSPDGKRLVVAEAQGNRVGAFDIAPDGSLSNYHVYAPLGELGVDGICLDAEGAVWVGAVGTGGFVRVLEGGKITHRVPVPGKMAIAPMLGGEDGRTLFMCTAQTTASDLLHIRSWGKSIGWIESVRVEVPHAGWP